MRRRLVAGNWKMNGTGTSLDEARKVAGAGSGSEVDVLICPPFTLISRMHELLRGTCVSVGAQDCDTEAAGARTGEISSEMLADAGASHVIVGHSERRQLHGETDELVRRKTHAAWRAGLVAIVCVGESRAVRDAGRTIEIVGRQITHGVPKGATSENTVIAYEPVWAIGSGTTPSAAEIAEVHSFARSELSRQAFDKFASGIRLLYGGSVNPRNAAEIFGIPNVDGALVGGASLKADDFLSIVGHATG